MPRLHPHKGLVTVELILGCTESAVIMVFFCFCVSLVPRLVHKSLGMRLLPCMILNTNQKTETRHYREEESKPAFLAAAILQAIKPSVFG